MHKFLWSVFIFSLWLYVFRTTISPSSGAKFNKLYSAIGTFVPVCLAAVRQNDARGPSSERWNYWASNDRQILTESSDFHAFFRDLLHASNLQHGTDGFTSLPKEGVLRIFSPWKIRRLWPGSNPWTWVPKASTLPLDHRSRVFYYKSLY